MTDKNLSQNSEAGKETSTNEDVPSERAFEQAEKDISRDPDMKPDGNEDLDEGELARKEGHP